MMFQHKSINDGLMKAIKNTVVPSEQIEEDFGASMLMGAGAVAASTAVVPAIAGAHQFLKERWNEHKTNRMFKNTFHDGAEVEHNSSGARGNISGSQRSDGRYNVKWHDGSHSAHHAGNDEADHEEPQISPVHWKD